MRTFWKAVLGACVVLASLSMAACGGGGGGGDGNAAAGSNAAVVNPATGNSVTVAVGAGQHAVNTPTTSVTICVPGTSNCQVIDNVLVDTGSTGLRLLASLVSLNLPQQAASGGTVAECAQFADGYVWGTMKSADIRLAGESAGNMPIQLIGDPSYAVPSTCSNTGGVAENSAATLQANGILGVGLFKQDCGAACVAGPVTPHYYACSAGSSCSPTALSLAQQIQNPVASFAVDNNGVVLVMPAIGAAGASNVTGQLIFGIGTQPNNALGSAQVLTTSAIGDFTTVFNGVSYPRSFIDSGSNGLFLNDGTTPVCSGSAAGFYCPAAAQALTATNQGVNGASNTVAFSIGNADALVANSATAYNNLAGPAFASKAVDFGLPFFFGRSVFTAIEGQTTPGGLGPYWAY